MPGIGLDLQRRPATALADVCLRHAQELNALLHDIDRRDSAVDLQTAKKMVGKMIGEIYVAALYPIFERYPDLKPPSMP